MEAVGRRAQRELRCTEVGGGHAATMELSCFKRQVGGGQLKRYARNDATPAGKCGLGWGRRRYFPSLVPGREKRTQSDEDLSVRAALPHPVRVPCSVSRVCVDEDEEEQEKEAGLFIHAEE